MTTVDVIPLSMPLGIARVNSYLLTGEDGRVLVDTGMPCNRGALESALGLLCARGPALQLIVLTHGDVDHAGNAARLRATYHVPVAMHRGDAAMVERGDMSAGRSHAGCLMGPLGTALMGFGPPRRFSPDLFLEDRDTLDDYGVAATVLHLLGHTGGSIGILTDQGDLLCGDLLQNRRHPALNRLLDQEAAARISLERLRRMPVRLVYPGHGKPFELDQVVMAGE